MKYKIFVLYLPVPLSLFSDVTSSVDRLAYWIAECIQLLPPPQFNYYCNVTPNFLPFIIMGFLRFIFWAVVSRTLFWCSFLKIRYKYCISDRETLPNNNNNMHIISTWLKILRETNRTMMIRLTAERKF